MTPAVRCPKFCGRVYPCFSHLRMKRWPVRQVPLNWQAPLVTQLVAAIGTADLAARLLDAIAQPGLLEASFCTVFAVGANGRIGTVSAASRYGDTAERTATAYIERRYDRFDPHMAWLAARPLPRKPQRWIGQLRAEEVQQADYRAACYTDVGIRERASVLVLLPSGLRAAVSFYRSLAQPAFEDADFAVLEAHAALLAEVTLAHTRSQWQTADAPAGRLPARLMTLSPREREVIGHLLAGRTAREAAEALGVGESTVRTHQYRAFRRLSIPNLKALLLAGQAGHAGPAGTQAAG